MSEPTHQNGIAAATEDAVKSSEGMPRANQRGDRGIDDVGDDRTGDIGHEAAYKPHVLYVIGDVHGMAGPLEAVLAMVDRDIARHGKPSRIVFAGDIIDRGPDSRRAVAIVRARVGETSRHRRDDPERRQPVETDCLMGNHERALTECLKNPTGPDQRQWLTTHCRETLASYGFDADAFCDPRRETWRARPEAPVLRDDAAWMAGLPRLIDHQPFIIAHAGLDPSRSLSDQDPTILVWGEDGIRKRWDAMPGGTPDNDTRARILVHGHYPSRGPKHDRAARRLNVDTAACYGGWLTAARLVDGEPVLFLKARADGASVRTRITSEPPFERLAQIETR